MKIKLFKTKYLLDYYLILFTPIIDTINGFMLRTNGMSDGLSIGSVYRILILIYIIYGSLKNKNVFIRVLLAFYFPFIGLVKGLLGYGFIPCLTYGTKWLLPVALINYYAFVKKDKKESFRCMIRVLDFWSFFVPVSLIIEYVFKLGIASYYDAGFKGYYYSTNDIALVLIVLFIYKLYKCFAKWNYKDFIMCTLNFVAIIVLSTKSCIIFAAISFVYMLIKCNKLKLKSALAIFAILPVGLFIFYNLNTEIENFFNRYLRMWNISGGSSFLSKFLVFATSGRTERISLFFDRINDGSFLINLLFGWISPDNVNVIEMDWYDVLCQYGLIGFIICTYEYVLLTIKGFKGTAPFLYIVIICFIYSILAGHVINGAFSGTCFSIVFSLLIVSENNTVERSISK